MAALSATLLRYITRQAAASTPDAMLLQRFVADRDDDAFAALVRRHGPIVYRVCRRLLGPTAADDAFQATFLVLATRAASVRKAGSVGSWLVGVAGRVARQMRKAECRREVRERAALVPVQARGADPLETDEQARILDDELTRLSDRLRGPVVACLLQGRTYEQAAVELGGSARTVRRRLDEAKRVLRARLERRGILPAVTAALIAGISSADAAVPVGLGARTAAAVSGFLAGGATIPAAIIAKGVATTMTTSVRMISALLATAAVGLTALGIGLAGDDKQSAPAVPRVPAAAAGPNPAPTIQPPVPAAAAAPGNVATVERGVPGDPPSAGSVRAVLREAEFLLSNISKKWLGRDWQYGRKTTLDVLGAVAGQPVPPPPPNAIRVMYWRSWQGGSSTQLTFEGGKLSRVWIDLSGSLDDVIDNQVPREITRVVMAAFFQRPMPWWADEGLASQAQSEKRQAQADIQCRMALVQGRGVRIKALFALKGPPQEAETVSAQAQSVARFLLGCKSQQVAIEDTGTGGRAFLVPASAEGGMLNFVSQGMKDGWDKAAKAVYGFNDVDALETAWLEWMKKHGSVIARPAPALEAAYPPLIPPVKLP